jgi:hypothetical protein
MTARLSTLTRPAHGVDYDGTTQHRRLGFGLATAGLVLVVVTLIANIVAGNDIAADPRGAAATLAWAFGFTTLGFGTIKLGIAVILIGILVRLWLRVESVKEALPDLRAGSTGGPVHVGAIDTAFGPAEGSSATPPPLPIHKMAHTMWAPMLAMGLLALAAGTVVSVAWSAAVDGGSASSVQTLSAWTQGLQFLGEGMLLAGISLLLGSILASLREGGGQTQEALGITVKTLRMPPTAKIFVGLMMLGLMAAVAQFVLYLVAAGADSAQSFAAWSAWLGPFRELGLGLLLSGVVMALVTIGNVLGFQFDRIKEIVATGL